MKLWHSVSAALFPGGHTGNTAPPAAEPPAASLPKAGGALASTVPPGVAAAAEGAAVGVLASGGAPPGTVPSGGAAAAPPHAADIGRDVVSYRIDKIADLNMCILCKFDASTGDVLKRIPLLTEVQGGASDWAIEADEASSKLFVISPSKKDNGKISVKTLLNEPEDEDTSWFYVLFLHPPTVSLAHWRTVVFLIVSLSALKSKLRIEWFLYGC